MESLKFSVPGIPPFRCEGNAMLVTGERGSAFICTDQSGTAAQNVEHFVAKIRKWLSENGYTEAMADHVFLHYPQEKSLCGKEYFLPIEIDDSLGSPMTRREIMNVLGCTDLPSAN